MKEFHKYLLTPYCQALGQMLGILREQRKCTPLWPLKKGNQLNKYKCRNKSREI